MNTINFKGDAKNREGGDQPQHSHPPLLSLSAVALLLLLSPLLPVELPETGTGIGERSLGEALGKRDSDSGLGLRV